MRRLVLVVCLIIVLIIIALFIDYSKLKKGEKPEFVFKTNIYTYNNGKVYEYIGAGYKLIDYSGVSDYTNIGFNIIFNKVKETQVNPSLKVDIRGKVENKMLNGGLLIKSNVSGATNYDYAWIEITQNTIIKHLSTGKLTRADNINSTQILEVGFDGAVTKSYPVRAKAKYITILD
ncbi:MAG: hypothetical protein N2749_02510 [Clostridia bacterium]|nr:hypothetical protein [Clostridia bacterium]